MTWNEWRRRGISRGISQRLVNYHAKISTTSWLFRHSITPSCSVMPAVDLEYVTNFATLAKTADIPYFGLLTSTVRISAACLLMAETALIQVLIAVVGCVQGANKDSWFLYPQTKGEVEENVKRLEFERTSVFRPGLLERGDLTRTVEMIASYVMPTVRSAASTRRYVATR